MEIMCSEVAYVDGSVTALSFAQEHDHTVLSIHECANQEYQNPDDETPASNPREQIKGRAKVGPDVRVSAEKVLRSFNTWAFKREQPSDPQLMLQVIATAIKAQEPIPFVLYWGKGPRHEMAAPETACLDFLSALVSRVRSVYKHGAAIKLILTDTHAELNGHARHNIHAYFDEIELAAKQRGFETCLLSHLVKAAGVIRPAVPLDEVVTAQTLASLVASAQKWYRGNATPEEGALTYLRMNLIEQRAVEHAFPRSIFVTFNGSDLRCLFPTKLPIFYMYSLRRGVSVKPWFLTAESEKFDFGSVREDPRPLN